MPDMEKRALGKTGMEVSVLGFGGAEIGFEDASLKDVDKLLGSALDEGLNIIDTAECYANSEEKIGRSVAHRRSDFFLFTKVGHESGLGGKDWDIDMMEKSIVRSLKLLKTDTVDLIQLHTCSKEQLEQGDVIALLERAREKGQTRFIGYSGDNESAIAAIDSGRFDTLQTSVNFAEINDCRAKLPRAHEAGLGVIAKRPIANAAWRYLDADDYNEYYKAYVARLKELKYPFLSDSDRAASIALRWTLAQPGIGTAIVGTKNPKRWHDNARILSEGALDPEIIGQIDEAWDKVAKDDWRGES
jgi:aryl-alcohol dehydrogenase-like predicted oxidoreductase